MSRKKELIGKLEAIVGKPNILTNGELFDELSKSTMKEQTHPSAVIIPSDKNDVFQIVKLFNDVNGESDEKFQLHPISSGRNWGYTCSEAGSDNAFLLYLVNLNNITEYDDTLGTVRIGAGVTQKQLYDFLKEKGLKFWMDATGSSVDCSVLGNSLERGFGHTPAGNHFEFISDLDVVLGNGKAISTGFRQFSGETKRFASEGIYKWGVGPYVDGIFSQSTLGIVTEATLKLIVAPECYLPFFITTQKDTNINVLVDRIRDLRERQVIKSCVHITNLDKSLQAALHESDWPLSEQALSEESRKRHTKSYMLNEWTASGALYGSIEEVEVWKKKIKRTFANGEFKVQFISEAKFKWLKKIAPKVSQLTGLKVDKTLDKLNSLMKLKRGEPTNDFLKSVHYKLTQLPPDNDFTKLERNNVGLIWLAPTAPATGKNAENLVSIVSEVLEEFDIESAISMTVLTPTAIECVISLLYDRRSEGADLQAEHCHNVLISRLIDNGYLTYRFNSFQHRDYVKYYSSNLKSSIQEIKRLLDPNSVIASGRYGL
jgi:4-cresol dehydrogenase (hydroxylating)